MYKPSPQGRENVSNHNNRNVQLADDGWRVKFFSSAMQVTVPRDGLYALFVSSPIAEVTVGPGLDVPRFTAAAPFSSGNINLIDMTVGTLVVQTSGCCLCFKPASFHFAHDLMSKQ